VIGTLGVYDTLKDVLGETKQYIRVEDICIFKKYKDTYIGINKDAPTTKKASMDFKISIYKTGNEIYIDLRSYSVFQKKYKESLTEIAEKMFIQKISEKRIAEPRTSNF
jgi:hypothetical protein